MNTGRAFKTAWMAGVPRDRPGFIIRHWEARRFEGQFDLTVMVALVEDHELEPQRSEEFLPQWAPHVARVPE